MSRYIHTFTFAEHLADSSVIAEILIHVLQINTGFIIILMNTVGSGKGEYNAWFFAWLENKERLGLALFFPKSLNAICYLIIKL